jgi:hypothetical protein
MNEVSTEILPRRVEIKLTENQKRNFWDKVDKRGPDDCWPWKLRISRHGYGQAAVNCPKETALAHRVAFTLAFGPIAQGLFVCHRCDVRNCCNPNHLFLGTNQDNMDDMNSKGRAVKVKGQDQHLSKLTPDKVLEIRSSYAHGGTSLKSLSKLYGVAKSGIYCIVHRKTWKHI